MLFQDDTFGQLRRPLLVVHSLLAWQLTVVSEAATWAGDNIGTGNVAENGGDGDCQSYHLDRDGARGFD